MGSERELVQFCYDVLLRKFANLEEIGILSIDTTFVLNTLSERFESVLQKPEVTIPPEELSTKKALEEENEALKGQIKALQSRYVKSGIISEREVQLDTEIKYLKRREKELMLRVRVSDKKCQDLMAGAAMLTELRAKNGLLGSRIRNQAELLQALSESASKQEKLIETVQNLRIENRQLQEQLDKHEASFEKIRDQLPEDSPFRETLMSLLTRNRDLHGELADKNLRLDDLSTTSSNVCLPETIEMLSDENFRLKTMIETNETLGDFMENPEKGRLNSHRIVEVLNVENQRLQQTLAAKREQVKFLTSNSPSSASALKALMRLREENKELKKALGLSEQMAKDWETEKKQLYDKVKKAMQAARENQQYRALAEQYNQLAQRLKEMESKYSATRKEYSTLLSKYDACRQEMQQTNDMLARTTAEYELLVKEYENIFGNFGKVD